jgi:predicted XRE-type DNA-binding protein
MKKKKIKLTKTFGDVIDALGFKAEEAAAIKLKCDLHSEVIRIIQKRKFTPRELEKILNQPQSRVSELLTGKLHKMSAEKLAIYLDKLGLKIEVRSLLKAA